MDQSVMPKNVLVVEDDPALCRVLASMLIREGYEPVVSTRPEDALELFAHTPFRLAFLDIMLPGMNGLDLARKLKALDRRCQIVFMTGYPSLDNALGAIKIGAYDYLRKPFDTNELSLCLKRYEEREAFQRKIEQAENQYYQLVQNTPLLIYVLRKDFTLEFINRMCCPILGFKCEEALSDSHWFLERFHPDDRNRIEMLHRSAFGGETASFSADCRLFHKSGHIIHGIIKSIPEDDGIQSECERLQGIIVDISDRVFFEKALVQKEKLKTLGAISAEVAHEIRNPLVAIGGFARRLKKKLPGVPEIEIIMTESARLEKILRRVRDYLRPMEFDYRECCAESLVKYCLELLAPELRRKRIETRLTLDGALPKVNGDPDTLTQVFINLIRNAVDAAGEGAALSISTYESDDNLHVRFGNEHRGRLIKNPDLLFLPFDEGGHSIGLPLCYRLLKNMGGMLSHSEEQGWIYFTASIPKIRTENTIAAHIAGV